MDELEKLLTELEEAAFYCGQWISSEPYAERVARCKAARQAILDYFKQTINKVVDEALRN